MARKHHFGRRGWLIILVVLIAVGVVCLRLGWAQQIRRLAERDQPGLYRVAYFVDGDTIAVDMNGHTERVRLIGIDTPETHKPNMPVQCYGPQAAAYTKATIGHQLIRLVSDSLSTDRDRYNRLLRYVYLPDGTNLDEKLVQNGYGFYYPYFPFSQAGQFATDEQTAMAAHKGLWSACQPTPTDSGGYVSNPQ